MPSDAISGGRPSPRGPTLVSMGPPTCQDVHRAMESAIARGIEGLQNMPEGVMLAARDRTGRWGEAGAYYAYCVRCGRWLSLDDALAHDACEGRWWNGRLVHAAAEWAPKLEEMAANVQRGTDPYFGLLDMRDTETPDGALPALEAGSRQLVRVHAPSLEAPLETVIDVPDLARSWGDDAQPPLKVLVYFHGHGEDFRHAPGSQRGLAVVAARCPRSVGGERCFWFQSGYGGAWERHEHAKLARCEEMLAAALVVVDAAAAALARLGPVEEKVYVMGVSMGGHAALEFAGSFPDRVTSAAVAAGYYEESRVGALVKKIAAIPLLLVHNHEDRCCPFKMIERLHQERLAFQRAATPTEAWFAPGNRHGPTSEEILAMQQWLLQWP